MQTVEAQRKDKIKEQQESEYNEMSKKKKDE
jgi:hypothetical protein